MIKKIKVCRGCKKELLRKSFPNAGGNGKWVRPYCKNCYNLHMRMKYQTDDKHREYMKKLSHEQFLRNKALKENNTNQYGKKNV